MTVLAKEFTVLKDGTAQVAELLSVLFEDGRAIETFGSWVNGKMRQGNGEAISLINPATGAEFMNYADAGEVVVEDAAAAAGAAQKQWWALPASARARAMWACSTKVREMQRRWPVLSRYLLVSRCGIAG